MPPDVDNTKLERRKLQLEIEELKASAKTKWTGTYWPVFAAVVTSAATLIGYLASTTAQNAEDRRTAFERSLTWATDFESPARRVAGATALGLVWGSNDDAVLASALASLLADRDPTVRTAAVAAFGEALTGTATVTQCATNTLDDVSRQRVELLYGDGRKGTIGMIPRQIAVLQEVSFRQIPAPPADAQWIRSAIDAAKEAIRVNWECLRGAGFRGLDLSGLQLYEANLQNANLMNANLEWTNLRGANLEGALLTGGAPNSEPYSTRVRYTNVKDLRVESGFHKWALENRAVEIDEEGWLKFRDYWRFLKEGEDIHIRDWDIWKRNGFKVDQAGQPLDPEGHSMVTEPQERTIEVRVR